MPRWLQALLKMLRRELDVATMLDIPELSCPEDAWLAKTVAAELDDPKASASVYVAKLTNLHAEALQYFSWYPSATRGELGAYARHRRYWTVEKLREHGLIVGIPPAAEETVEYENWAHNLKMRTLASCDCSDCRILQREYKEVAKAQADHGRSDPDQGIRGLQRIPGSEKTHLEKVWNKR